MFSNTPFSYVSTPFQFCCILFPYFQSSPTAIVKLMVSSAFLVQCNIFAALSSIRQPLNIADRLSPQFCVQSPHADSYSIYALFFILIKYLVFINEFLTKSLNSTNMICVIPMSPICLNLLTESFPFQIILRMTN